MVPRSPIEQPIKHHNVLIEDFFHVCLHVHILFPY